MERLNVYEKIKIYNTLSGQKEEFNSIGSGIASDSGLYVCGITPYDTTHIGHAFTYTFFDVVYRYLKYLGYNVKYVQNITDVDEPLFSRAKKTGEPWNEIAERNSRIFFEDMNWLNNLKPDVIPKASENIEDMIFFIEKIKKKGFAYENEGNVYFPIDSFKDYGKLSKLSREQMLPAANERGNNPDDANKRNPLDFVLWQSTDEEPCWKSPWSYGRPGWHIECSVMSMKYLGDTIDISGGGSDLIFPHHESSIAQSETVTGKKFVKYWMHTAMINYKGQKMSKKRGNLFLVRDLKHYDSNTVRLFLLSHNYRKEWEFNYTDIETFSKKNKLFRKAMNSESGAGKEVDISSYKTTFFKAFNDDFNIPKAVSVLEDLSKELIAYSVVMGNTGAKLFLKKGLSLLGLEYAS